MQQTLKAPGSKRLKLEHEKLISNFAFDLNLRRYSTDKAFLEELLMRVLTTQCFACITHTMYDGPNDRCTRCRNEPMNPHSNTLVERCTLKPVDIRVRNSPCVTCKLESALC
jgi:hypothetical protein